MKPVSLNDYYRCKRCYGGVDIDFASLTDFYLPLIGTHGYAIYQCFLREDDGNHLHKDLLSLLHLTPGEFENALSALEAVGLVRTFVHKTGSTGLFVYWLDAPLSAEGFNQDVLLSGTFKGRYGADLYAQILSRYTPTKPNEDMEEVTSSFPQVFEMNFEPEAYTSAAKQNTVSPNRGSVANPFDQVAFLRLLEENGYRKGYFSKSELKQIAGVATFYSFDENQLFEAIVMHGCTYFNKPCGERLNLNKLEQVCYQQSTVRSLYPPKTKESGVSDETLLGKKIKKMDSLKPAEYLRFRQNGNNPADVDLRLLKHLQFDLGLPGPCVNALVDYTLDTKDNSLPYSYCEKLAAVLIRDGCQTAKDAMDSLYRSHRKMRKKKEVTTTENDDPASGDPMPLDTDIVDSSNEDDVSDEELDAALRALKGE